MIYTNIYVSAVQSHEKHNYAAFALFLTPLDNCSLQLSPTHIVYMLEITCVLITIA